MIEMEASGVWYRPWAGDREVIKNVPKDYAELPIQPGDVCLDVGAHIGVATLLMLGKGASKVVAVEPDPSSFELLERNTATLPVERIWAAVADHTGWTELFLLPNRRSMNNTYRASRNRTPVAVPAVTLETLLEEHRPNVLKVDAEFAEHRMAALRQLPAYVRALQLEVHLRYGSPHETLLLRRSGRELLDAIAAAGFNLIRQKELTARNQYLPDATGFGPYATSIECTWSR